MTDVLEPAAPADVVDASRLEWITGRPVPMDHDGPVDVPFLPLPEAWERQPLLDSYAEIVARHPDRIAVDDGVNRLTFEEVRRAADDLIARIHAVAPADRPVAAFVRNDATFLIAYLAGIGLGRPSVVLTVGDPRERQASIMAEVQPGAAILAPDVDREANAIPADLPCITVDPRIPGQLPRPAIEVDMDAPLNLGFTSGSTGNPKGIVRPMRVALSYLPTELAFFHLNPDDVILGIAPPSHSGLWGPSAASFSGARLRLLDMKAAGVEESLRIMGDEGVSILVFVPSALRALMQLPGIERAFRKLRVLALGSERIQASDIALFRSKLPPSCKIAIILGSVDAGLMFRWYVPEGTVESPLPVGYLEPSKAIALVGEDGRSVPPGEAGELYIRGRDMGTGLWQAGRLVPGQYQPDPEDARSAIYRSHDMALQRPDGLFEFLGRADQMVKIRGLRVDLGEVEAALRAVPGVTDAVAVVRAREGSTDQLVAFVSPAPGAELPPEADMRRGVGQATAQHMIPTEIRVLPAIPRLYNHKADLVQLRALALQPRPRPS